MEALRVLALIGLVVAAAGIGSAKSAVAQETTTAQQLTRQRKALAFRDMDDVGTTEGDALLDAIRQRQAELGPKAEAIQTELNELRRAEQECQFLLDYQVKTGRRATPTQGPPKGTQP